MKHHATVQSARERYISRFEEMLNNFLRIFHDGCCTVHARFEPGRDASYVQSFCKIDMGEGEGVGFAFPEKTY